MPRDSISMAQTLCICLIWIREAVCVSQPWHNWWHYFDSTSRGSSSALPASIFFGAGDLLFRSTKNPKQTDRRQTKRGPFFNTMRITPPIVAILRIDLQQRWSINRKISNRQSTYYLIVRALAILVLLFFLAATLGRNNIVNYCRFFEESPFDVPTRVV